MTDKNTEKDLDKTTIEPIITEEEQDSVDTDSIVEEMMNSSEKHKKVEFISEDELLNDDDENELQEKIKLKDIQDKRLKELTKDERKVAGGHFLIITIFLILTACIILHFVNFDTDDRVVDSSGYSDILNEKELEGDSEYTRYITKDTIDDIDENSKWKTDEELNKKLTEVLENEEKLEEMDGYQLQGILE